MTLIITSCTNRKRKPVELRLTASALASGDLLSVSEQWGDRLNAASIEYPASEVYGGRGFQEARLAAKELGGEMLIVSAGLGTVEASEPIPSYACTVQRNAQDSIAARVETGFSNPAWWARLAAVSPYHRDLCSALDATEGLILAALSEAYLDLITDDLLRSGGGGFAQLRIFTRTPASRLPQELRGNVMPYDDRLDGPDSPLRGARSDFAQRALRHFAERIMPSWAGASAKEHAEAVKGALRDWRYPQSVERSRLDDDEIVKLLEEHWDAAGGSSTKLLRLFRDDLKVACEQGRFAMLARQVRAERS